MTDIEKEKALIGEFPTIEEMLENAQLLVFNVLFVATMLLIAFS